MPLRALRLAVLTTASAVVATTVCLGTSVPALADDTLPPVAANDAFTVEALGSGSGGVTFLDVLANDSAAAGETLEICRVLAPERGLAVAEADAGGNFMIQTPNTGIGASGSPAEEGARESVVVLPWHNRAGTYQLTYWACDSKHLTPATVTVTVRKTPVVTVQKVDRPGRLRFANPGTRGAVVLYGGLRDERPDGRFRLAPGARETREMEHRVIRWVAFSRRSGEVISDGIVRGIRLPGTSRRSGVASEGGGPQLTPALLRAWRRA